MPVPSIVAATSLRALPRKRLSRWLGQLSRVPAPEQVLTPLMRAYCRAYGVDLRDCIVPDAGFATFDEFFTRRLKPGTRPVDPDPSVLVSPADGRLEDAGPIERGATITVKGKRYLIGELLGDDLAGRELEGGSFAVVYLSPRDYHRVHAAVSGPVTAVRHVPGTLFPVNAIGVKHVPNLLARNERVVVHQRSELHGRVVTVLVGAVGVGRISLSFDDSVLTNDGRPSGLRVYGERPPTLERGDELGVFHLGSTVVVLTDPRHPVTLQAGAGACVRMGDAIARMEPR
jgi:phosphatidylserine decarboxylase